ncbi:MAG TPA: carbamoyltransferase C-terminal domain-containing protein [Blastocatellia bacterium]|jgi:carbamoyltransferase|nr:carbamoyltransferase C-terminal domain-containing protein [Blastocatellia bacterium]
MIILGISGQEKDAAAALVRDGRVVAVIEEEKIARVRHVGMIYSGGLPFRAIDFCLERAGVGIEEIDTIAYYMEPHKLFNREVAFHSSLAIDVPVEQASDGLPGYFVESLNDLRQRLRTIRLAEGLISGRGELVQVNHQLAQGASAFYPSGFDRAAVMVLSNKGDMISGSLMTGAGSSLELLAESGFPNSVGMVYGAVTAALGFDPANDWNKTMWLSPTGEPEFADLFDELLQVGPDGLPVVNRGFFDAFLKSGPTLTEEFFERLGVRPRAKDEPLTRKHRNIAASLQKRVEDVTCEVAARLRARTGEANLCLAGIGALNSMTNAAVERRAGFERIFAQPASGSAGASLGAALNVWHQTLGNTERAYEMKHVFVGPQFDEESIKSVLDNCKLDYDYFPAEDKLIGEVAGLLAEGSIVAWFRGAMEFGPRALGARSILASPTDVMARDNLNIYVKHREDYRPFSAAVPEEQAGEFFEPSQLTNFLQGVSRIKEGKQALIPAAVFGEGLVRVHTASRKTNPSFWKLLVRFGEITGVPVLLNTSFNLFGEPVVSTPREAVRGFYCSGIDCLAIGNFLIKK